jgi:hypothetical protein
LQGGEGIEMTVLEHAERVALIGVTGSRPTVGPVAGPPLLPVDHAELTGSSA